jgi:glutaconate CoA-transferase subunit A
MRDKRTTLDDAVAGLRDGMTIGIGGWGSRRKPMALVEAILRTPVRDLTLVSFGGPDVGMLCAAGKLREVVFGFVSLDSIAYDPYFARARQDGAIAVRELDEGMVVAGLRAAAQRLPFLPIRAGLGSDVLTYYPELRTVRSPYDDGEELVAMPALPLDVAFVHLNRADPHGNAAYLGPDPYFDDLFCLAAKHRVLSAEQVVPTAELVAAAPPQALLLNRMMVDAVVEAPGGAGFTSCIPDYGRNESAQREYAAGAKS